MKMKLNHIAIIVSDYPRALKFYSILGFQEIEYYDRGFDILGMLEHNGIVLEVFEKSAPARITNPEALGLRHIAFTVTDLDAHIEILRESHIPVESVRVDVHGKRFTFIKDPDGLPIEFKEE